MATELNDIEKAGRASASIERSSRDNARAHVVDDLTEMTLNMGPQHPSTHGVLRVVLKLDGETVVDLDCDIGYLHRGVEKICENRTYTMITPYWDRTDYVAAMGGTLSYVLAVEKLMQVEYRNVR
jgi:NADH-quinone oxidoreductase subunit D